MKKLKSAFYLLILSVGFLYNATAANTHEYWIETENYALESGEPFEGALRNGQDFSGYSFPYISDLFELFEQKVRGESFTVESEQGSVPAIAERILPEGLNSFAFVSKPKSLAFTEFKKFEDYLIYEGLERFVDVHRARGLPEQDFKETYQRFAKMLVQVGPISSLDQDVAHGLAFEWVALDSPYREKARAEGTRFKLLYRGKPLTNWPFNVFFKTDLEGTTTRRELLKTDENGIFLLPADSLAGSYMLNAVNLFEPENSAEYAWGSSWASITFALNAAPK